MSSTLEDFCVDILVKKILEYRLKTFRGDLPNYEYVLQKIHQDEHPINYSSLLENHQNDYPSWYHDILPTHQKLIQDRLIEKECELAKIMDWRDLNNNRILAKPDCLSYPLR